MLYCVICLIYCRIAHVKVVIFSRCLKNFDLLGTINLMMHNIFIYSAKEIHPYDRECNYESLLCTVVCQFTHWKVVFHQSIFLYIYMYVCFQVVVETGQNWDILSSCKSIFFSYMNSQCWYICYKNTIIVASIITLIWF